MPAITLTDLSFSYTAEPLLDSVSFTVVNGERACLIGPNGADKTTLLERIVTGSAPTAESSNSIEALEKALAEWDGTLLVASHDRWLLDHWAGERIELEPVVRGSSERPAPATRWRIIDFKDGEL
ncbi:Hemin import ATP-binding protein HmuV [Actinomyces bovis]|uniref:Hemin import ATP-binding protein HmuV n=1 Tax=Actinomyces bovis TaxID=1658 RepID=A0ABY1VQ01_9ACTO|nr:ATP-binding cassette domain-containing protein [Actinomyces bovis]SPT54194.1 Hemin import ATP-binding protein HmuV [Actinomyces bovis]VEG56567.1 Hemin import ATP-binding protein HmuV [Actinomyces israelii]